MKNPLLPAAIFAALVACAPAYKAPAVSNQVSPWNTPEWKTESARRNQLDEEELQKWGSCRLRKATELARSELTSVVAATKAIAECKTQREEWLETVVNPGNCQVVPCNISRSLAEMKANNIENASFDFLREHIVELRSRHRS
jgi:hypothetical protein